MTQDEFMAHIGLKKQVQELVKQIPLDQGVVDGLKAGRYPKEMEKADWQTILAHELEAARQQAAAYAEKGIPEQIYWDTMKAFARFEQEYEKDFKEPGFVSGPWAVRHTGMKIFRLGLLEYEFREHDICIHIPTDAPLEEAEIEASISQAKAFTKTYFPEKENFPILTDSWLLVPAMREVLDEKSAIRRFQNHFAIQAVDETDDNYVKYVFGRQYYRTGNTDFPEATTLQKWAKKRGKLGTATGIWKD